MNAKTPTVIVDRSSLFREGLGRLLLDTAFEPVACAGSLDKVHGLEALRSERVLFLADFGPDASTAAELVRNVKQDHRQSRVVVLADRFDPKYMNEIVRAGADGYLIKTIAYDALVKSMELVMLGTPVFPGAIRDTMIGLASTRRPTSDEASRPARTLSDRETQILQCLVRGDANKIIARNLDITESTVKVHIKAILRKIRVKNRTQAAIWAVDQGMAPDDGDDGSGDEDPEYDPTSLPPLRDGLQGRPAEPHAT